ncbi:MAG: Hpt domain-containing protein [Gammaproteobacteria bacterium]|nr:Hpt domain-containing protein [Gammaproteobacteria bacterium]
MINVLNEPSIDDAALTALKEATEEMFAEIIEVYLEDTPKRLSLLLSALEENNINAMLEESHCLKGSSGNIGALKLSKICAEIESQSKAGSITNQKEYLQHAFNEFDHIRKKLTDFI